MFRMHTGVECVCMQTRSDSSEMQECELRKDDETAEVFFYDSITYVGFFAKCRDKKINFTFLYFLFFWHFLCYLQWIAITNQ